MIQKAVICFCLLFLCMGIPVQAGTLSGDGAGVSVGQTKVTAHVAADGASPEDNGSGKDERASVTEGTAGTARAEGPRPAVRSQDASAVAAFTAVSVMSGLVILILIRRRS